MGAERYRVTGQGVIHHADRFPVQATACGTSGPAARDWRNVTCPGCLARHPQEAGPPLVEPGSVITVARALVIELRRYVREHPSVSARVAVEVGQLWTWWARRNRDRGAPQELPAGTLAAAAGFAAMAGVCEVINVTGYAWVNEIQIRLPAAARRAA